MKSKISLNQLAGCLVPLIVGIVEVTAANPVLAQRSLEKMPLQMVQSSALTGSWRLANMTEPPFPTPMLPSTDITADFSGDSPEERLRQRVTGSGGCNRFMGS